MQATSPVGLTSAPRTYVIDLCSVQQFRRAIAVSPDLPSSNTTVPLTYAVTLTSDPIAGLNLPAAGLIHGEQRFHYGAPLKIGDQITVHSEVSAYRERSGTAFITLTTRGHHRDETLAFEAESLILAPVRREVGTHD